jgi:hypothetical protein
MPDAPDRRSLGSVRVPVLLGLAAVLGGSIAGCGGTSTSHRAKHLDNSAVTSTTCPASHGMVVKVCNGTNGGGYLSPNPPTTTSTTAKPVAPLTQGPGAVTPTTQQPVSSAAVTSPPPPTTTTTTLLTMAVPDFIGSTTFNAESNRTWHVEVGGCTPLSGPPPPLNPNEAPTGSQVVEQAPAPGTRVTLSVYEWNTNKPVVTVFEEAWNINEPQLNPCTGTPNS